MRRRICGLIGRLPITGFDTRLASGSSLRGTLWPACTWPPPRARLFGIRIGCGRARRASWAGAVRGLHANRVKRPCGPRTGAYRCAALSCVLRPASERNGRGARDGGRGGVGAVRVNGTDGEACPCDATCDRTRAGRFGSGCGCTLGLFFSKVARYDLGDGVWNVTVGVHARGHMIRWKNTNRNSLLQRYNCTIIIAFYYEQSSWLAYRFPSLATVRLTRVSLFSLEFHQIHVSSHQFLFIYLQKNSSFI